MSILSLKFVFVLVNFLGFGDRFTNHSRRYNPVRASRLGLGPALRNIMTQRINNSGVCRALPGSAQC